MINLYIANQVKLPNPSQPTTGVVPEIQICLPGTPTSPPEEAVDDEIIPAPETVESSSSFP